jgi:hypothetical protein
MLIYFMMFSLPLFLDIEFGISTMPSLAQQYEGTLAPGWWNDCKWISVFVRSSMRAMSNAPDPNSPGLPKGLEEWLRSFVPTETAIDGGLYPDRLGDGMLGFDYASFRLAGERAPLPEVDPKRAEEIERRFASGIGSRERLTPAK